MDLTIGKKYEVIEIVFGKVIIYIIDDSRMKVEISNYMYKWNKK
jgi:hypothetical protein